MEKLIHLGCALQWLTTLEDGVAGAVITDPPYASGGQSTQQKQVATFAKYSGAKTINYVDFAGDTRDQRSHLNWYLLWLEQCHRILKNNGVICVFSDWRQLPLTTDALQMSDFIWRGIAVWDKTEATRPQLGRFRCQAEYIVWASKGDMPRSRKAPVIPGVLRQMVKPQEKQHLTGKPLELMRKIVQICEDGELIIDPFAGSGTTLVAGLLEGYKVLGCEKLAHYYQISLDRLNEIAQSTTTELHQTNLA